MPSSPRPVRPPQDRFHFHMAIACAVVAFAGFAPTYWVPLAAGTFAGRPVMHIHGLIFSAWTLFFVYQTWLVARERSVRHRAVGLAGISLATGMVILGVLASISQMKGAEAQGLLPAGKAFAIVPLAGLLFFAVLVTIAIAKVVNQR